LLYVRRLSNIQVRVVQIAIMT